MPHLSNPFGTTTGPLLDVTFGPSVPRQLALARTGQPVPPRIAVRALIDTGASHTCIDFRVATQLNLLSTGVTEAHIPSTQGGAQTCDVYDVSILMPSTTPGAAALRIAALPAIGVSLVAQGVDALIGRDVLAGCTLFYDGPGKRFILSY